MINSGQIFPFFFEQKHMLWQHIEVRKTLVIGIPLVITFQEANIWPRIEQYKQIFVEPRSKGILNEVNRGKNFLFLAQLFSKKTSRYCHSPVLCGGVCVGIVMQKLRHFLISLSLLEIPT